VHFNIVKIYSSTSFNDVLHVTTIVFPSMFCKNSQRSVEFFYSFEVTFWYVVMLTHLMIFVLDAINNYKAAVH